jgi:hypothetical protein
MNSCFGALGPKSGPTLEAIPGVQLEPSMRT